MELKLSNQPHVDAVRDIDHFLRERLKEVGERLKAIQIEARALAEERGFLDKESQEIRRTIDAMVTIRSYAKKVAEGEKGANLEPSFYPFSDCEPAPPFRLSMGEK